MALWQIRCVYLTTSILCGLTTDIVIWISGPAFDLSVCRPQLKFADQYHSQKDLRPFCGDWMLRAFGSLVMWGFHMLVFSSSLICASFFVIVMNQLRVHHSCEQTLAGNFCPCNWCTVISPIRYPDFWTFNLQDIQQDVSKQVIKFQTADQNCFSCPNKSGHLRLWLQVLFYSKKQITNAMTTFGTTLPSFITQNVKFPIHHAPWSNVRNGMKTFTHRYNCLYSENGIKIVLSLWWINMCKHFPIGEANNPGPEWHNLLSWTLPDLEINLSSWKLIQICQWFTWSVKHNWLNRASVKKPEHKTSKPQFCFWRTNQTKNKEITQAEHHLPPSGGVAIVTTHPIRCMNHW